MTARAPSPASIVYWLSGLKLGLHLGVLGQYGYFRDELYYIACSDRLAFGYVDHPPLSIALLRAWRAAFGDSLEAIRTAPALAGALVVLLAGRVAIDLGGGRLAAALACLAVIASPIRLGFDHYYSMNALDGLFWALAAWLALRAAAPADAGEPPRRGAWIALGAVLGLGVLDKWSVLWLGFGLLAGIAATPARRLLRTPWPWAAAAIAAAIAAPHFVWQARNGWPTLDFMRSALELKYVRLPFGDFLKEVALSNNPGAAPVWAAGLAAPFLRVDLRRARLLAWAFLATFAIVAISRGKPEYLAAAFPLVIAPGAVAWERALAGVRPAARRAASAALVVAMAGLGLVALPLALPVLPVERLIAYQARIGVRPESSEKKEMGVLPQHYADMFGWPELADAAAQAFATLAPEERQDAVVWAVTGGYGPAAAIDFFGKERGLPRAISTHNNYFLWGPGPAEPRAVILLGGPRERLETLFEQVTPVTTVECGDCMPYENHKPVWVGRGLRRRLADVWPELRNYQ